MSVEATNSAANQAAAQVAQQAAKMAPEIANPKDVAKQSAESIEQTVEKLQKATAQLNELMKNGQRSLNFSVDDVSNKVIVKVVDRSTSELVRQIPTKEALELAEHIEGMMGLIFNRQI